jgi:hypothetical protein
MWTCSSTASDVPAVSRDAASQRHKDKDQVISMGTMASELTALMDSAQRQMQQFDEAARWQKRSVELAERDGVQAWRTGFTDEAELFASPSRSAGGRTHQLRLFAAGAHKDQLHCTCQACSYGLPCAHAGAVLQLIEHERHTISRWREAAGH